MKLTSVLCAFALASAVAAPALATPGKQPTKTANKALIKKVIAGKSAKPTLKPVKAVVRVSEAPAPQVSPSIPHDSSLVRRAFSQPKGKSWGSKVSETLSSVAVAILLAPLWLTAGGHRDANR